MTTHTHHPTPSDTYQLLSPPRSSDDFKCHAFHLPRSPCIRIRHSPSICNYPRAFIFGVSPPPLCKSGASVTMQVPKIEPKYQGRAETPTRQTPVEDLSLLCRQHFAEEIWSVMLEDIFGDELGANIRMLVSGRIVLPRDDAKLFKALYKTEA